ncbi:hypothetical protein HNS03_19845 [Amorphus sp. 3PC139-8]
MVYGPSEADADADGCLYAESPCGDLGMLYAPEHTAADGNDCVAGLAIDENGMAVMSNGIKLGDQSTCDGDHEGVLRYNPAVKTVLFCDGEYWQEIGAAPETSTTFNDVTDAEPGQTYTTGEAAVSGFFGERTVTASNGALILVNGGLQGASASVSDGDKVQLRLTASNNFSTSKSTTMTLGSLSTSWTVTTREQDTTPNNFNFVDLTGQETDAIVTSNTATVSGFDGPLTATVSGQGSPQIRTGSGSWGTSASVSPGQSLRVRLTTSGSELTTRVATVSLGDVDADWSVLTKASTCSLPWGGTIANGESVVAYSGWRENCTGGDGVNNCSSQIRVCDNGNLTGSYNKQSCTVRCCPSGNRVGSAQSVAEVIADVAAGPIILTMIHKVHPYALELGSRIKNMSVIERNIKPPLFVVKTTVSISRNAALHGVSVSAALNFA